MNSIQATVFGVFIVLAYAWYKRVGKIRKLIRVAIATSSKLKVDAVMASFVKFYQHHFSHLKVDFEFKPTNAKSLINEQPFGLLETLKGVENRFQSCKGLLEHEGTFDFFVSIENGLLEYGHLDIGFVSIEDTQTGRRALSSSPGVEFPSAIIHEAQSLGFDKVHCGTVLAQSRSDQGISSQDDKNDPHRFLTGNHTSRGELLEFAVQIALSQLLL